MKEVLSAFGSEVFRPLMTLFAPGIVALVTWITGFMRNNTFEALVKENRTEASLLMVLAALVVGMVLEDFSSWLEVRTFDPALDDLTDRQHSSNWCSYLRLAWRMEPVGARYMRTILLRMKFELGMASALVVAAFGTLTLSADALSLVTLAATLLAAAALLYREGRKSHYVLSCTRAQLLKGITLIGEFNEQGANARGVSSAAS